MSDKISYSFKIEGMTPVSMSFRRLISYYEEIRKMLDIEDSIHLIGICEGSHESKFAVDPGINGKLTKRIMDINNGCAPRQAIKAWDTINKMLREDGTSGAFSDIKGKNVITFPGESAARDTVLVRDAASFVGELYHIARIKNDIKIRVNADTYGVVLGTTTREIGKALRGFLFENIKVIGKGIWVRGEDGDWSIDDFIVTEFVPISYGNLRETINELRKIEVSWPDDPIGLLEEIEENGKQLH